MTREISHQQSFEKALYSMQNNFPPGKLPGMKAFENVYFSMSTGEGDMRGPWNNEPTFEYREAEPAVDGGTGMPETTVSEEDAALVERMAVRTQSDLVPIRPPGRNSADATAQHGSALRAPDRRGEPSRGFMNGHSAAGIAIQDVPEGMVVALALRGVGYSRFAAVAAGMASESSNRSPPSLAQLRSRSRAACCLGPGVRGGGMLYAICHEAIPGAPQQGNASQATEGVVLAFVLMMLLDTALSP